MDQQFRFLKRFKVHAWCVLGLFSRLSAITGTRGPTLPRRAFCARALACSAIHRGSDGLATRCCCHAGPASWPPLTPCHADVPFHCRAAALAASLASSACRRVEPWMSTRPVALPHPTSRRCRCHRIIALRCATSPPRRCTHEAEPMSPCHLWHYGAWATPTSSACRRLAPAMGHTGCTSHIMPRCTRQLPTASSSPLVLSFLPCPPLCARPPLFSSSCRGHGEPGCRHLPSISRAHVCALMSACQPSPPRLESVHDELQFGSPPPSCH